MSEVAHRVVDLEDVFGPRAPALVEQLYEAPGWDARFTLLDSAIAARLGKHLPASPDVAWAWRRLTETEGLVTIGTLTEELGCSRRHLTARFREQVGMPPKTLARILRFERAVRRLREGGNASLAELAYECGYYDQAHFNRDFRRFAGITPSEFLARVLPDGGGVSGA
jgi:AraC-like DNA-binding protein